MSDDGIERITLRTPWSDCVVSPFGGQVLGFRLHGGRDLFWMTSQPKPLPAPIRGGVPVCWPWFARQGVPADAPQHGTVRTLRWRIDELASAPDGTLTLAMSPDIGTRRLHASDTVSDALDVSLQVEVGRSLTLTLATRNHSATPQPLTQALHGYLALGDVARARIEGLDGVDYLDNRAAGARRTQQGVFAAPAACERIYHGFASDPQLTLVDETDGRRVRLAVQGSRSIVVWNPGADLSAGFADLPAGDWQRFVCIEPANAGPDARLLAPGAEHRLVQRLELLAD